MTFQMGKKFQRDIIACRTSGRKKQKEIKKLLRKKTFTQRKTNSDENKRNEESNISNRKGNSNNINEERRDTPNPRRHNLGNYNNYRSRN